MNSIFCIISIVTAVVTTFATDINPLLSCAWILASVGFGLAFAIESRNVRN